MTLHLMAAAACGVAFAAEPINTGTLLRELVDLRRLAEWTDPAYRTVQFSSYDRRSNLPGGPDWFANSDGFGGEPIPGFEGVVREPGPDGVGEYLICDVEGPGAIVRTWSAAIDGRLRVVLDDEGTPIFEGPAADFLSCPYQALAEPDALDTAFLDGTLRQHQAAYCPIPFAKRCRMVWIGDLKKVHFYQVQIRCYTAGAAVRTFSKQDLTEFAPALRDAVRILRNPAGEYPSAGSAEPVAILAALDPGEVAEVLKLEGPQALERLTLKLGAPDLDRALRQTVLNVICDGHPWGQVQAPVGGFFGAAPGINPFDALPFSVAPDGTMTCRYVMPFESSLRMVLENRGDQTVSVSGSAAPTPYRWTERSLHFRARWRVDHGVHASPQAVRDVPFVIANGAGRYVGTALMLLNPARVPTPYGGWWGEGDEKIFVDDDVLPSTFGTGSEDYFNYAWSVPDIFVHPYCGQPRNDGPGNRGFVTNDRWHIVDDLPFRSRLSFYLELYPHDNVPGMSYARIGYYYARPGTGDDHVVISDEDLRALELPEDWQPTAAFAMQNSVYLQAEDIAAADARTHVTEGRLWAGGKMLTWRPNAASKSLTLRFSVPEEGQYRLHLCLALDDQASRITTQLDGQSVSFGGEDGTLDLHVPYRLLARQFSADGTELKQGEHVLAILYAGAADNIANPQVGVDYLAVQGQ